MRTRIAAITLALATAAGLTAAPATAVTGGTPDGDAHPNVALILYYTDEGRFRCSATLIDEDVLLTAAHCTDGVVGEVLVTFDSVIAEEPPSPFPVAADPSAGYTEEELAAAGYLSGNAFTHPDYSDFTDLDNWYDVGVVVLDEPVEGIEPAELADVGTLDAIPQRQLRRTLFTAVGYGTEVRKAEEGPQNPQPMSYPLIRRYAEMPGRQITPQIIETNGNLNDRFGTGGTCFGDSGGPLFLGDVIVGVTSYTYNNVCRYLGGYQRVDIPGVREWLDTFLD